MQIFISFNTREFGDMVRIGKESDIDHEMGVRGDSALETKGLNFDLHGCRFLRLRPPRFGAWT